MPEEALTSFAVGYMTHICASGIVIEVRK